MFQSINKNLIMIFEIYFIYYLTGTLIYYWYKYMIPIQLSLSLTRYSIYLQFMLQVVQYALEIWKDL